MEWATPFAFVVYCSGSGLGVAVLVHLTGWFLAPERVLPFINNT